MVKVSISEKRNLIPQSLELGENVKITTWGAIKVNKSHFFPSSFQIKSNEKVIYIDPVEIESSDIADYIFITHSHPDHFSLKTIEKIMKPETIVICAKSVSKKLPKTDYMIKIVKPGDILELDGLRFETVAAYNDKEKVFLWIKAHPKSKQNVGYILTLNNGIRIYHAGDTGYIPEMKNISNIDVALIPIGGDNLTMNMEDASRMANEVKPKFVIPMHYELIMHDSLTKFKNLVNKSIHVKVLE